MPTPTVADTVLAAYRLAGLVPSAGALYSPSQGAEGLLALNAQLDAFKIQNYTIYALTVTDFAMIPNQQKYLLGTDATVKPPDVLMPRPPKIRAIALLYTNVSPILEIPLLLYNDQEWEAVGIKTLSTPMPTAGWYQPTVPNGTLWMYGVPQTAWSIRLYTEMVLQEVKSLTDTLVLPPGYNEAVVYNLALRLADLNPLRAKPNQRIVVAARAALALIKANNAEPILMRAEAVGTRQRGRYNILSNTWSH